MLAYFLESICHIFEKNSLISHTRAGKHFALQLIVFFFLVLLDMSDIFLNFFFFLDFKELNNLLCYLVS